MSLWSRFKDFLGIGKFKDFLGIGKSQPAEPTTPPPPQPPRPPEPPRPPRRPTDQVDRSVHPRDERYEDVWGKLQDKLDSSLSQRGVEAFNQRQDRLAALFDIIGDPNQSDHIQTDAYEELADELAEFGFIFGHQFNVSDFDWEGFAANYPMMEK